ncbi:hypothetical protein Taro_013135 [Colocasia esculenta]|uniref:Protein DETOXIFICATION n=1 Tax=Colocasia esculenta TaxID=4460 RepID=A0A843UAR6_COLES|nr:hypothetical protein [Colocasia esculenta]
MAGTAVPRPLVALHHRPNQENPRHGYPTSAIPSPRGRRSSGTRFGIPPASSLQKNPVPKVDPAAEPERSVRRRAVDSASRTRTSFPRSVTRLFRRIRKELKVDEVGFEIITIALPAVLSLAADPFASLVDTAFVGHLGPVQLAAVGVSASVFNLVSKLFNVPLLNVTTSFVAEDQALDEDGKIRSPRLNQNDKSLGLESTLREPVDSGAQCKRFLPAVSTSLVLAAGVGIVEAIALACGSGLLMNIMGISVVRQYPLTSLNMKLLLLLFTKSSTLLILGPHWSCVDLKGQPNLTCKKPGPDSPMRAPAEHFLTLRAWGAPPIVIALAAQGTFRGFKDTKTPLFAVGVGNLLNAILDPILIFLLDLGIGGAAIATTISEYLIAFILIWKLNENVLLIPPDMDGKGILRYLKSGGLLIGRTIAVLITMTLSTSMAAREGPVAMAGHQICLQVWLAVSLLNDALALAGQALLASAYTQANYKQAQVVIDRSLQMGLITGIVLAITLFLGFGSFSELFTTDSAVLAIARSGVLFVTVSQPVNALAFVFDGLYYGLSDFAYAAYSMVLVALLSSLFLLVVAPAFGLAGVWTGLLLFMLLRVVAGIWRLYSKNSPWEIVRMEIRESDGEQ